MKKIKKITAVVLALILACSAVSLNVSALDNEYVSENLKLYTDVDGNYYIIQGLSLYYDMKSTVTIYSVDGNGKRTAVKEFSQEEVEAFSNHEPIPVSADTFVEGGKYEVKVVDPTEGATPTDASWYASGVYALTYDDLLGGTPVFSEGYHFIYEEMRFDLADFILMPVGYEGEISFTATTYDDYFGESIIPGVKKYIEIDGTFVTGVDDGKTYVEMFDENGVYLDMCIVEVEETAPSSIFELMGNSAEKITEGLIDAVSNLGSNIITSAFLMVLPVVLPFAFFISFILNVIIFPY